MFSDRKFLLAVCQHSQAPLFPPVQQKRADILWLLSVPILYGKMKSKEMDESNFFRQSVIKEQNAKCSKFSADEDEISTHV